MTDMQNYMNQLLMLAVGLGASDIHICVGKHPFIRKDRDLMPIPKFQPMNSKETRDLIFSILTQEQRQEFNETLELDLSYNIKGLCRFRVNVLQQKREIEAVLRVIPTTIPKPNELAFTPAMMQFTHYTRGLVLITGPTGSGKSTTMASLIEDINVNRKEHIITIEDPIEFVYEPKNCIIRQREVGNDTHSFAQALKHVLRQDPDIILVGEMRDLETISMAITAAETGHLVFATLHTQDAAQTIDRIIDVFPPHQQQQVRVQLSNTIQGVISQQLVPTVDGKRVVAAREIMVVTKAIANLIREGKTHQLYGAIDIGAKHGMISMDSALSILVQKRIITPNVAISKSYYPDILRDKLMGMRSRPGGQQAPGPPRVKQRNPIA